MKTRIFLFCAVILAVCLWLVLHRAAPTKSSPMETQTPLTNQQSAIQSAQLETPAQPQSTSVPNAGEIPPRPPLTGISNLQQQILADWQRPIEFYGKVVDENTNPVAGAKVVFKWAETPSKEGNRTANTESDSEGLFSLRGQHGPSLEIWVSKDVYYASHRGQKGVSYLHGDFSPDPLNPVIFLLRKKGVGESLVGSDFPGFVHIAQLHHDGTPVELDLYKGTQVSAGNDQLKLEFWRDISNMSKQPFDWKLQISAPGGGLIATDEEFAFLAPESGYQPSVVIDMPATNQVWQGELRTKYYIQLPGGKYGRIDFYLLPYNGVFTVQSAINPTGSRNLEPVQ